MPVLLTDDIEAFLLRHNAAACARRHEYNMRQCMAMLFFSLRRAAKRVIGA